MEFRQSREYIESLDLKLYECRETLKLDITLILDGKKYSVAISLCESAFRFDFMSLTIYFFVEIN